MGPRSATEATPLPAFPASGVSRRALLGVVGAAVAGAVPLRGWLAAAHATPALGVDPSVHHRRKPVNHSRPVISDRTPSVGQTISVTHGKWS